jgi:hypothetical protein
VSTQGGGEGILDAVLSRLDGSIRAGPNGESYGAETNLVSILWNAGQFELNANNSISSQLYRTMSNPSQSGKTRFVESMSKDPKFGVLIDPGPSAT